MSELQLKRPIGGGNKGSGKWVVLGVLCALLVLVFVRQLTTKRNRIAHANTPQAVATQPTAGAAPATVVSITWTTQRDRDPFASWRTTSVVQQQPSLTKVADASETPEALRQKAQRELRLTSTIIGARPVAIINQQLCSPGSVIAGYTLVEVRQRSVVVKRDAVTILISLHTPLADQTSKIDR